MPQVLLQSLVVELREKVGLGGLVELANPVDQLTFVHGVFTFQWRTRAGPHEQEFPNRARVVVQPARSVIAPLSLER
jgi:hypothetical protein